MISGFFFFIFHPLYGDRVDPVNDQKGTENEVFRYQISEEKVTEDDTRYRYGKGEGRYGARIVPLKQDCRGDETEACNNDSLIKNGQGYGERKVERAVIFEKEACKKKERDAHNELPEHELGRIKALQHLFDIDNTDSEEKGAGKDKHIPGNGKGTDILLIVENKDNAEKSKDQSGYFSYVQRIARNKEMGEKGNEKDIGVHQDRAVACRAVEHAKIKEADLHHKKDTVKQMKSKLFSIRNSNGGFAYFCP